MTFTEAAMAYELQQSGCSLKFMAPFFGVHRTWLGKVIESCLVHGKDSPLLDAKVGGSKPRFSEKTLVKVRAMHLNGVPHKVIARNLRLDPDKLVRAYNYYDRKTTI